MLLVIIPGTNERTEAGAGASLARAVKAGMPAGGINDGYRPHAEQVTMFLSRYRVQWTGRGIYGDVRWWRGKRYVRTSGAGMAAIPGTSVHGDGLAVDFAHQQRTWMFAHGAAYGWFNTIRSEPWHWEYKAKKDKRATEDEMTPAQEAKLNAIYDALFKTSTISGSTTGGNDMPGGLLRMASINYDATFQVEDQNEATRNGVFENLRLILKRLNE